MVPYIYSPLEIKRNGTMEEYKLGHWRPARPISFYGLYLKHRVKSAWNVFIGKYDAVDWEKDN